MSSVCLSRVCDGASDPFTILSFYNPDRLSRYQNKTEVQNVQMHVFPFISSYFLNIQLSNYYVKCKNIEKVSEIGVTLYLIPLDICHKISIHDKQVSLTSEYQSKKNMAYLLQRKKQGRQFGHRSGADKSEIKFDF